MFKVGQLVEVVDNRGMAALLGATAVVTRANHDFIGYEVINVEWKTHSNGQGSGGYRTCHFKPVFTKNQQLLFSFMSATEGT